MRTLSIVLGRCPLGKRRCSGARPLAAMAFGVRWVPGEGMVGVPTSPSPRPLQDFSSLSASHNSSKPVLLQFKLQHPVCCLRHSVSARMMMMLGLFLPHLPPGLCRIAGNSATLTYLVVLALGSAQREGLGTDLGNFQPWRHNYSCSSLACS